MIAHKHRDIIVAWVNGANIQGRSPSTGEWIDVPNVNELGNDNDYLSPSPIHPDYDWWSEWRVNPYQNSDHLSFATKVDSIPTEGMRTIFKDGKPVGDV